MNSGMPLSISVGVALCLAPGQMWAIQLAWVAETPAGLGIEGIKAEGLDGGDEVQLLALAANPRHHLMKHVTPPKATNLPTDRSERHLRRTVNRRVAKMTRRQGPLNPLFPKIVDPMRPSAGP